MGIGIFAILWKLRTVPWPHGRRFSLYLMLVGTERFLIEFIRTNNEYLFGLSGAQIISICMFIIGITLINKLGKGSHDDSAAGAET
jgi:phosphatidylglycerol:prolipoprotein diacylglycerol transferase